MDGLKGLVEAQRLTIQELVEKNRILEERVGYKALIEEMGHKKATEFLRELELVRGERALNEALIRKYHDPDCVLK